MNSSSIHKTIRIYMLFVCYGFATVLEHVGRNSKQWEPILALFLISWISCLRFVCFGFVIVLRVCWKQWETMANEWESILDLFAIFGVLF